MKSYKTLNENDTILIKDLFDLEEALINKNGVEGYKYTVNERKEYSPVTSSSCTPHVIVLYLNRSDDKEFILIYLPKVDLFSIYQQIPGVDLGNRQDLLNQDLYCFFNQPEDENNFTAKDLTICEYPNFSFTHNDLEVKVSYNASEYLSLINNKTKDLTSFYWFDDKTENCNERFKQFIIIEEGGFDKETYELNPDGGLMRMLVGRDINITDLEIFDDGK